MNRALRPLLAALLSLAWTACSTADPAEPMSIEPEKSFMLRPGSVAQTFDGALRIGFDGVTVDSRCPKNEQCVWAGDAVARVWVQQRAGPRVTHELHTAPGAAQTLRLRDQELRLVRLDPHPITSAALAKPDYVATLILRPNAAVDSDR